jgi:hypothetical protein
VRSYFLEQEKAQWRALMEVEWLQQISGRPANNIEREEALIEPERTIEQILPHPEEDSKQHKSSNDCLIVEKCPCVFRRPSTRKVHGSPYTTLVASEGQSTEESGAMLPQEVIVFENLFRVFHYQSWLKRVRRHVGEAVPVSFFICGQASA